MKQKYFYSIFQGGWNTTLIPCEKMDFLGNYETLKDAKDAFKRLKKDIAFYENNKYVITELWTHIIDDYDNDFVKIRCVYDIQNNKIIEEKHYDK